MTLTPNQTYEVSNDLETWEPRELAFIYHGYAYVKSKLDFAKDVLVQKYKFIRKVKK